MSSSDKDLFSIGLRLIIPPKQIDYSNIMVGFELLCRNTLDLFMAYEERDRFKTKLMGVALLSLKLFSYNCIFEINLLTEEIISLKALIRNENIMTQKGDKGNTVAITDKKKYIDGVKSAGSDSNKLNITRCKYLKITKLEKMSMITFFLKVLAQKYIVVILKSINQLSKSPKFRPTLSSVNTPRYNKAKFEMLLVKLLAHNEFNIKNSINFTEEITTHDSLKYMSSFDVESLFTNILLNKAISNCVSDLHNKHLYNGKISKRNFLKLLETATIETSFLFD